MYNVLLINIMIIVMGIEGIYWGYGFTINYKDLAQLLNIDITNMTTRKAFECIEHYTNYNKLHDFYFTILQSSHHMDDNENNDEDDDAIPDTVYFGVFFQIGGYDCWGKNVISKTESTKMKELQSMSIEIFNDIYDKTFQNNYAEIMTVVTGCPCCS